MKRYILEIIGCMPFCLLGFFGIYMYIRNNDYHNIIQVGLMICSTALLLIGIWSPISVYLRCGDEEI